MYLTKHKIHETRKWALDGRFLPSEFDFKELLTLSSTEIDKYLSHVRTEGTADGDLLAPIEDDQEVWACGVTYTRSREAREAETAVKDIYDKVYEAQRPELFFKATGWRVQGTQSAIRIRNDSHWNVPEPELTLVINSAGQIVGYCIGNDVSSRSIEGENPLYLPQAKIYDRSCALGPGIVITDVENIRDLLIRLRIDRQGKVIVEDEIRSSRMKRTLEELAAYLTMEMTFPYGVFLMTGTGIVPAETFTLKVGDQVTITIDGLVLENVVEP